MRAIVFILLLALSAAACKDKVSRPSDILDPKKMSEVMAEVQILEATYNLQYARLDSSKAIMEKGFEQIFAKAGVSRESFEKSLQYYSLLPQEMISIQEDVADLLMAKEAEIRTGK
jgi:hypothetical protein